MAECLCQFLKNGVDLPVLGLVATRMVGHLSVQLCIMVHLDKAKTLHPVNGVLGTGRSRPIYTKLIMEIGRYNNGREKILILVVPLKKI